MELTVFVNDTDFTDAVRFESVTIQKELTERVSTAGLTFFIDSLGSALYDEANYDVDTYGVDVRELNEIRMEDENGTVHFAGLITKIDYGREDGSANLNLAKCTCNDWNLLLERAFIVSATFTGQTVRAILQSLITTYAPSVTALTANISNTDVIDYWEVKEKTLRQAIQELHELTGDEWRIDFLKAFHSFPAASGAAPFGLSTSPNNTTTFEYVLAGYSRDFIRPVNRCTVLGGILAGGTEISQTYNDFISQQVYGVHSATIIDREISTAVVAMMRAQAEVEANAYPQISGSIRQWRDGLDIGQLLPIYHADYALNDSFLIRSLGLKWLTKTDVEYDIEFGAPQPQLERKIRQIVARNSGRQIPRAVPVDGTVTDSSIGSGGLNVSGLVGIITAGGNVAIDAEVLVGTVTAGQNVTIDASVVAGTFTAGNNVIIDANTIQGVITGPNVAVDVTTFQGVIVSSQVADNLIDRLGMYANALRPIPNLAAAPSLPSANHPEGSFYYNTTSGNFWVVTSGAWVLTNESTAISGKLEFYHIGTIKAGSIIGLIAAANIGSVNAGSIIGSLTATQIASVNMSSLTGTLSAANAGRIDIGVVQGNLDVSRVSNLGSISISTFTGNLDASRVGNLGSISIGSFSGTLDASRLTNLGSINIGSLSGTLTTGQVGTININSFTGTLDGSKFGSLTIQNAHLAGGITDNKILEVSVAKLIAGTANIGGNNFTLQSTGAVLGSGAYTVGSSFLSDDSFSCQSTTIGFTGLNSNRVTCGTFSCTAGATGTITYAKSGGGSGTITVSGGIITSYT